MPPPSKPRIRVPDTIKAGDVIEVRALVSHPMESGQRKDAEGNIVPRSIINTFVASFDGREVFRADLHPAISANPYISFHLRVPRSGELEIKWVDDTAASVLEKVRLEVA